MASDLLRRQYDEMVSDNATLTAQLAAVTAERDALTAERDAARAWSARWKDVARRLSRAARKQAREHYTSWQRACDDTVRLAAERDALRARAERAELALAGMLESYELCMGSELAFSALTKDILRGVFINEPERARAALAAAGEGE